MKQEPCLIDIGLNLTHDSFDSDRGEVVARALAAGVCQMILTGSSLSGSEEALQLARAHPGTMFATAGVHPHHVKDCDEKTMPGLRELARAGEIVAVGECGLDFFRNYSPRPVQEEWLGRQLELAVEVGLPVFLHERDSHPTFAAILRRHRQGLAGVVVHCFTGNRAALEEYLGLDCHIGVTGWICDERRGRHLQELVRMIPAERLLLETDAPYLLPRDLDPKPRGNRNEPACLPHVARTVARCLGRSWEEVAAVTTGNARRLFRLPEPA